MTEQPKVKLEKLSVAESAQVSAVINREIRRLDRLASTEAQRINRGGEKRGALSSALMSRAQMERALAKLQPMLQEP